MDYDWTDFWVNFTDKNYYLSHDFYCFKQTIQPSTDPNIFMHLDCIPSLDYCSQ